MKTGGRHNIVRVVVVASTDRQEALLCLGGCGRFAVTVTDREGRRWVRKHPPFTSEEYLA